MGKQDWSTADIEIFERTKDKFAFVEAPEATKAVMNTKAKQSCVCYDSLKSYLGLTDVAPVVFCTDPTQYEKMQNASFEGLTYPDAVRAFFAEQRISAVMRLFQEEKVLQTPPLAGILAAVANEAQEIAKLNGAKIDPKTPIYCNVAYAGMQAVRVYFVSSLQEKFSLARAGSAAQVVNAYNGIFNKYHTKDDRDFSFHLYYDSQKEKIIQAMGFGKDAKDVNMFSQAEDIKHLQELVATYDGEALEEFVFANEGSGCMIRNRAEWNNIPVGKAVNEMPLLHFEKNNANGLKNKKLGGSRGPLEGLKVLDLTHIIAGPACCRLLGEYGADVLLVRRKSFGEQAQSCTELDGWAGRRAIDLDLKQPEALAKIKELIQEADVLVYSYQSNAFDQFGLSKEEIFALNPNLILSSLMCFSETVWNDRPGWAPLAEDITGLSIRNGSKEQPKNLNGVPLDYIPGLILTLGTFDAIRRSLKEGGGYSVVTSLTRGAVWLHECTDLCEQKTADTVTSASYEEIAPTYPVWNKVDYTVEDNAVGAIAFPVPATYASQLPDVVGNMQFVDGCHGFRKG